MPSWRIDLLATAPPQETSSGLSRVVWDLSAHLVARGHSVRVLYPAPPGSATAMWRGVAAVPIDDRPAGRRPFARDIALGRAASRQIDPSADLVVGNDEKAGALVLPGPGPRRPAFAMIVHDVGLHTFDTLRPLAPPGGLRQKIGDWLDRRALQRLERSAFGSARRIVIGSELNRDLLKRHYGIVGDRIVLIPFGVPDPHPPVGREAARRALKVPLDVPVVSFLGRTPDRQGLPIALDAFRRVRVLFPGARFLVAGSGAASEPGVMALGVVDEVVKNRLLEASDVFLFPARYEGFGLAPREAMQRSVATIVSSHVPLDGIDPKAAVRIVASDDPGDYASVLAELFSDPAMRRAIGAAGRVYAERFSFATMAERFEESMRPLLDGRASH